jgi:restriction endonuclease S subunit
MRSCFTVCVETSPLALFTGFLFKIYDSFIDHSIHIGAGNFIEGISPTSSKSIIIKLCKAAIKKAKADKDTLDVNELDMELAYLDNTKNLTNDNSDDNDQFTAGDIVSKALTDTHAEGLRGDLCTNASAKGFGTFVRNLSWGVGGSRGCREV